MSAPFPAFLGIPNPISNPSCPCHRTQGFPQAWSQSLEAPAPHPLTATAPLNPRDRHVGLLGWFPFLPLPSSSTFPCCSLSPEPAKTQLQERAAQLMEGTWEGKTTTVCVCVGGVPDVLSFFALGVPSGF